MTLSPKTPKYYRTSGHVLVCGASSCQQRGSPLLYKALWNALETHALAYYKAGGSVRLTQSGCLGACKFGPTVCAYRTRPEGGLEEGWYAAVDFPLALQIARAMHAGEPLPATHRYGPE